MYCVRCGVKLADSQKRCPLCDTVVFHPDITQPEGEPMYPRDHYPDPPVQPLGLLTIVSALFLAPIFITLLCDLQISGRISWSGYVIGALLLAYIAFILPNWFPKPNPVIFTPIAMGAVGLYLLYINLETGGHWFLSFAFPVTGFVGLLLTALVTLFRYIRRGRLYILSGAVLLTGAFMPVMELLLTVTFESIHFIGWSFYPLIGFVLLGIVLLVMAISRPIRDSVRKRSFF